MISRAQAEEIAARWARGESEQRGYGCAPSIAEFEHGYVIWTRPPPEVLPVPGDGARTVIDRATGVVSTWPSIPVDDIATLYRDRRPATPTTVDPSVALLRLLHRRPAPTTVAHLTVDGRLFRAQGAKGDQSIRHHPLVAAHLASLTVGARVRGAERHAELIALSDALHAGAPKTLDAARAWLIDARFEAYSVRDHGDPHGGRPARPCETCLATLVDFAVLPWSDLAFTAEWRPSFAGTRKSPDRFPAETERVLAAGGWTGAALGRFEPAAQSAGDHLPLFPAAERAIAEFAGVRCGRRGPGRRRAIRLLTLDPAEAAPASASVTEFAEVLGVPLFPIGTEGSDAIVTIDERGRVFLLDQAGEWFVGATLDGALTSLLTGDGPAERVQDDGTW